VTDDGGGLGFLASRPLDKIIDGSGLIDVNTTPADLLDDTHIFNDDPSDNRAYFISGNNLFDSSDTITFALGATVSLDQVHYWQYSGSASQVDRGLRGVTVSFSTDGTNFTNPVVLSFDEGTVDAPQAVQTRSFATQTASHVRFSDMSNGGDAYLAMGEVRFGFSGGGAGNDYDLWGADYPGLGLPGDDDDGDGLTNDEERIWGLDPTSGGSANPISVPLDPAGGGTGTFSYTRRDASLTGLVYTIWTSSDLANWTEDAAATAGQNAGAPDANDIETVVVILTASPIGGKLFAHVRASQ
jgi:hypothetical protein